MVKRKIKQRSKNRWSILVVCMVVFWIPFGYTINVDEKIDTEEVILDENITCSIENKTFQAGEKITYKIYYNWNFVWLPAGEVVFQVGEEQNAYKFSADGSTYKTYEWFFKVNDQYECIVDKKTLLPTSAERNVEEGKYRLYDKITFDHDEQKAISLRGKSKNKTVLKEFEVEPCVHDVLSIIYFTRNLDVENYKEGQQIPVKIFMDKEVWPLKVKYQGKEEKKKIKGKGKFKTLRFSPETIEGTVFKEGTRMNIWVSDDENRIPLLIESPLSVGSIKAVVKDYKGLKYDMTARIK